MMLVQLARLAGASTITVFDIVPEKLGWHLKTVQIMHRIQQKKGSLKAIELAGGRYDCVLEGTGATAAAKLGLRFWLVTEMQFTSQCTERIPSFR